MKEHGIGFFQIINVSSFFKIKYCTKHYFVYFETCRRLKEVSICVKLSEKVSEWY